MTSAPTVFLVDDDIAVLKALSRLLRSAGFAVDTFISAQAFLDADRAAAAGCVVLDVAMPGLDGHALQQALAACGSHLPIIFLTGNGNIPMTVRAMKAGAADFLTKPVPSKVLIERIQAVLQEEAQRYEQVESRQAFQNRLDQLTSREMEILPLALAGHPNKEIARQLGISFRTVVTHRIRILQKTETTNFRELSRLCEAFLFKPEPKL